MPDISYTDGLDRFAPWDGSTSYLWVLVSNLYVASPDHRVLAEADPWEISAAGYARDAVSGLSRAIDDTTHRVTYLCDPPAFGAMTAGQTIGGLVLIRFGTGGYDSPLLAFYDVPDVDTGAWVNPALPPTGVGYVDAA